VIIGFLVVFPIIYIQTIAGIKSTDQQLLQMADVFQMSEVKRFFLSLSSGAASLSGKWLPGGAGYELEIRNCRRGNRRSSPFNW
jgi:ABC-type tungstate transport system substrate-binding protein